MKFTVHREAIAEGLAFASEIVKVRTPKPALTAVLIVAEGKGVTLVATDMDVATRWPLTQVDVISPGQALIPCTKLMSVINSMGDDVVTVENAGDATLVKGADSLFKLYGYDPKDLLPIAEFTPSAADVIVPGAELARMIEQTEYAMAKESTRYAVNALLFERLGSKFNLIGTDGHRLAFTKRDTKDGADFGWAVSRRLVLLLQKLLTPDSICRMQIGGTGAFFSLSTEGDPKGTMLRGALCEGTFPHYDAIWPKDCTKKAVVNTKRLLGAIKQAELLTNEESKGIRLAFSKGTVQLSGRATQVGEATIDVPCEYEGDAFEIGFNPSYLAGALKPVHADTVVLEMSSPHKPLLLKLDDGAQAVVMPVKLS